MASNPLDQTHGMADALVALFGGAGYVRVEPAVLQPADVFLDLSGEDIRRRMFVTSDAQGREWTLRPEFTIPVARAWLDDPGRASPAQFSYCGPVFRLRPGESGEFWQAGVESFGRSDLEAADAEVVGLGLDAVIAAGADDVEVSLGDVGLFTALLDALALPAARRRKLQRAFAQGRLAPASVDEYANGGPQGGEHAGLLAALQGQAPRAAHAFVEDLLKIAGISAVGGGRTAGEIAERFLAQAAAEADGSLGEETRAILRAYVAISGDPDAASAEMRALAETAGLDLSAVLDAFDARTGFLAARGVDVSRVAFSAGFGRNLDYYTGMVFEIRVAGRADARPLVGGGRYDRLLQTLGAAEPVPAVGCSVWLDRLPGGPA